MESLDGKPGTRDDSPNQIAKDNGTTKKVCFDDLPFEIGAMIFKDCDLRWLWPEYEQRPPLSMPALIIALRQQPKSYYQALEIF